LTEVSTSEDRSRTSTWLSAVLFFGAVGLIVTGIMWLYPDSDTELAVEETTTTTTTTVPDEVEVTFPDDGDGQEPIADAAEIILPSVVHIQTRTGVGSGWSMATVSS
jgi:hypothetical protein